MVLFTDASLDGWGGHMDSLAVSGTWPQLLRSYPINWLELEAIRLTLSHFKRQVAHKHVLIMSDNVTAIAYLNKQGGTRSQSLMDLTQKIILWCRDNRTRIFCRHIAGHLNVKADSLSRKNQVLSTEWSLHPRVVDAIWQRWF